ncbi:prephenate dehydratase domain-containing protein, partial [Cellulosimicrobium cellulans]
MSVVGYLGPEGSFTHQAAAAWCADHADGRADRSAGLAARTSVADVFAGVAAGELARGVVAIENTVEG